MNKTNRQRLDEILIKLEAMLADSPDGRIDGLPVRADIKTITAYIMHGETDDDTKERIRNVLKCVKGLPF